MERAKTFLAGILSVIIVISLLIIFVPNMINSKENKEKNIFLEKVLDVYENANEILKTGNYKEVAMITSESNLIVNNNNLTYCVVVKNNQIVKFLISNGKYIIDSNQGLNELIFNNIKPGTLNDFNCDSINLLKYKDLEINEDEETTPVIKEEEKKEKQQENKKEETKQDKLEQEQKTEQENNNIKIDEEVINIKNIVVEDRSGDYCAQAIEYFYSDNEYTYYFNCIKSGSMYVIVNGKEYKLVNALNNGIVTMKELNDAGYFFSKKERNLSDK